MSQRREAAMVDAFIGVLTVFRDRVAEHRGGMSARQVADLEADLTSSVIIVGHFRQELERNPL